MRGAAIDGNFVCACHRVNKAERDKVEPSEITTFECIDHKEVRKAVDER